MIGIGNKPFVRGEGPASWDEGVAMNFIEIESGHGHLPKECIFDHSDIPE